MEKYIDIKERTIDTEEQSILSSLSKIKKESYYKGIFVMLDALKEKMKKEEVDIIKLEDIEELYEYITKQI